MSWQHGTPVWVTTIGTVPLASLGIEGTVSEADIRSLVRQHPRCLPIAEIDPIFVGPVPICTELRTNAGFIDNLMVTPSGLPVIVECKLWRNPGGCGARWLAKPLIMPEILADGHRPICRVR